MSTQARACVCVCECCHGYLNKGKLEEMWRETSENRRDEVDGDEGSIDHE